MDYKYNLTALWNKSIDADGCGQQLVSIARLIPAAPIPGSILATNAIANIVIAIAQTE